VGLLCRRSHTAQDRHYEGLALVVEERAWVPIGGNWQMLVRVRDQAGTTRGSLRL